MACSTTAAFYNQETALIANPGIVRGSLLRGYGVGRVTVTVCLQPKGGPLYMG